MTQVQAEYITKHAGAVAAVAGSLGRFLSETMPKAFSAIRGGASTIGITEATTKATALGLSKAQAVTTGVGAAAGAIRGASEAEPGQKGKAALKGGIVGGVLGGVVGHGINKIPEMGKVFTKNWTPVGQKLMETAVKNPGITAKELGQKGVDYAAKNMGVQWKPTAVTNAPEGMKDILRRAPKALEQQVEPKDIASRAVAHGAKTFKAMQEHGILEGGAKRVFEEANKHRYYTRSTPGINGAPDTVFRAKRSLPGQAAALLTGSSVGMGVYDVVKKKDDQGNPQSLGKRIRKGTIDTFGWGLAPPVMAGKLVHDVSKIMGGRNKPQQELINQGAI